MKIPLRISDYFKIIVAIAMIAMAIGLLLESPSAVIATRFSSDPEPTKPEGFIGTEGGTFNGVAPKLVVEVPAGYLPNGAQFIAYQFDKQLPSVSRYRVIGSPFCFGTWLLGEGRVAENFAQKIALIRNYTDVSPQPPLTQAQEQALQLAFYDQAKSTWVPIPEQDKADVKNKRLKAQTNSLLLSRICDPAKPQALLGIVLEVPPTPTPTNTPIPTATPTATRTPLPTNTATALPTSTATRIVTPTSSPTNTAVPVATATFTVIPAPINTTVALLVPTLSPPSAPPPPENIPWLGILAGGGILAIIGVLIFVRRRK